MFELLVMVVYGDSGSFEELLGQVQIGVEDNIGP